MAQTMDYTLPSSFPHADMFSSALMAMISTVQPGIVQVHTHGRGGGTGIVLDTDGQTGRILTNNHVVVRDTARVEVSLLDGRTLKATVLHRDELLDLALLQVTGENLIPLQVGDSSQLRVGEWVFAIGHPWGQRWVVTAGILSSRSAVKTRKGQTLHYLKSDVRLAPGNSCGPLLDADGNVIGINAMIFGGDLSVAIPSDTVTKWVEGLS